MQGFDGNGGVTEEEALARAIAESQAIEDSEVDAFDPSRPNVDNMTYE